MSEWFMEPVLKTGDAARHRGFESLSLRQNKARQTFYIQLWRSTQVAVRGSPAKGVGWGDWREGSNPSFSAIYVHNSDVVHIVFLEENIAVNVIAFQSIIKGIEI